MSEFAELIGTEQSTISRYESGQLVPSRTVIILLLLMADENEKPGLQEALGVSDAFANERFGDPTRVLEEILAIRGRGAKHSSVVAFAEQASKLVAQGKPIDSSLTDLVRLWQLHIDNKVLRQTLEHMLPYFRFLAGESSVQPTTRKE